MTHKQKRVFFNWLKKHGALEKYKCNRFVFIHEHQRQGWVHSYDYVSLAAFDALGLAFNWCRTPEGHTYWRDLDEVWMKEYRKIMGRML